MRSSCKESNKNGKNIRKRPKLKVKKMYLGLILHHMKIYPQEISQFHITMEVIVIMETTTSQTKMIMGLEEKVATLQIIFIETIKLVDTIIHKISKGSIKMDITSQIKLLVVKNNSTRVMEEEATVGKVMVLTAVIMGTDGAVKVVAMGTTQEVAITITTNKITIIMRTIVDSKRNSSMEQDINQVVIRNGTI